MVVFLSEEKLFRTLEKSIRTARFSYAIHFVTQSKVKMIINVRGCAEILPKFGLMRWLSEKLMRL